VARVPYLPRGEVAPDLQEIYDALVREAGIVPNFHKALAHFPNASTAYQALRTALRIGPWILGCGSWPTSSPPSSTAAAPEWRTAIKDPGLGAVKLSSANTALITLSGATSKVTISAP